MPRTNQKFEKEKYIFPRSNAFQACDALADRIIQNSYQCQLADQALEVN